MTGSEKQKSYRTRRTAWIREIKLASGCVDCGYNEHAEALDFDHLGDKSFALSDWYGRGKAEILAEIEKCEVVCSNCHRVRTARRRTA